MAASDGTFHEQRMQRAKSIRRRLAAHIEAGGTTDLAQQSMRLPSDCYTDPERWKLERRKLFESLPLVACLSQDISQPGDRIVFEVSGHSILIVRDSVGQVRAFHNRCAHRGARLLPTDETVGPRNSRRIVCPFHGWNYDLGGELISVPGREAFESSALAKCRLSPIAAMEWAGIIFVRLLGDAPLDAREHLQSFAGELETLELRLMRKAQSSRLVAQTNWKYAIDTYAEGYHFGVLHAGSIGQSHFSNIAVFESFSPHWILHFPERALADLLGQHEDEWPDARHGGTYFLFPNTVLVAGDLGPGERFIRMFRIFPGGGPGEMSCLLSVYVAGISVEEFRERFAGVDDSKSDVTREDFDVAEGAWCNLANNDHNIDLLLGRNEIAVQAFHRAIFETTGLGRESY